MSPSISAGRYHYTVILDDGSVVTWGDNNFGQTKVPNFNGTVASVSSGYYSSYAITEDGQVKGWGLDGYLMGTDGFGRDVFRRLIVGGRMTMTVGAIAVIISTFIGVIVGGVSGYKGGKLDNLLMRLTEIVSSPSPFLPFCIILSSILGNSISELQRIILIMFILGFLSWPGIAPPGARQRAGRARAGSSSPRPRLWASRSSASSSATSLPNIITVIIVNGHLGFRHLHADGILPVLHRLRCQRAQRHMGQHAQRRPERPGYRELLVAVGVPVLGAGHLHHQHQLRGRWLA